MPEITNRSYPLLCLDDATPIQAIPQRLFIFKTKGYTLEFPENMASEVAGVGGWDEKDGKFIYSFIPNSHNHFTFVFKKQGHLFTIHCLLNPNNTISAISDENPPPEAVGQQFYPSGEKITLSELATQLKNFYIPLLLKLDASFETNVLMNPTASCYKLNFSTNNLRLINRSDFTQRNEFNFCVHDSLPMVQCRIENSGIFILSFYTSTTNFPVIEENNLSGVEVNGEFIPLAPKGSAVGLPQLASFLNLLNNKLNSSSKEEIHSSETIQDSASSERDTPTTLEKQVFSEIKDSLPVQSISERTEPLEKIDSSFYPQPVQEKEPTPIQANKSSSFNQEGDDMRLIQKILSQLRQETEQHRNEDRESKIIAEAVRKIRESEEQNSENREIELIQKILKTLKNS